MTTNFHINGTDTDDLFVRKDIFTEGGLWLWGRNNLGQLGNNQANMFGTADKSSPVQTIAGGTNWKQIDSGYYHTAAIKTDGTLWTWGANGYGELGDNTIISKSSPVQTIAGGTNWKQVSCGAFFISAIKTDGTLWLWGNNDFGQLGISNTLNYSSPVQTVAGGTNWKQVSCGSNFTAAIKTDGTLWTWGRNDYGQLGTFNITNRSSPVQTIAGGTNWKQIDSGGVHTAAIKTDGTLWTWGRNNYGQLGDNTIVNKLSPIQTVSAGTNWKQVSCGGISISGNDGSYFTAAIKTDGTLWLWGDNFYGQLGDNTSTFRSSPIQTIAGGTNWKQVSCGGNYITVAIKTDGTLWTWGKNFNGELGDNTIISKSSPVQTIAGGTNWKQVSCGVSHISGIRDDYWA